MIKRGYWRNACHLLANSLGGDGDRYENLATCSRTANSYAIDKRGPDYPGRNMDYWEKKVVKAVQGGQIVSYSVVPKYSGSGVVPIGFEMNAVGFDPATGAMTPIATNEFVPNVMYSLHDGAWHNMGYSSPSGLVY
ncbi:DNA/RNA non-specific endonuclease [Streptomyces sp. TLI_171]|uniref:DNA/RNA non-specific endonuclease n=1 Tax=Streptomyces sp. TLI_171 TaxID=1938859 RepID=UPI0037D9A674